MSSSAHRSVVLGALVLLLGSGCECEATSRVERLPRLPTSDAGRAVLLAPDAGRPDAGSPAPEPTRRSLAAFLEEPSVVAEEDAVASGAGVSDARIRLVGFPPLVRSPGQPFVWAAARTGRSGRFRLSAPADRPGPNPGVRPELLLVETDETSRTVEVSGLSGPRVLPDIRLPSVATVRVELHCRALYPEEEERLRFPSLVAIWPRRGARAARPVRDEDAFTIRFDRRDEEDWTYRVLPPEGTDWPEPFFPGRDLDSGGPIPVGTERFAAEITLPRGQRMRLELGGACGSAVREVDVPDTGSMAPIVFRLPDPEESALEVRLTGAPTTPHRPTDYLLDVWADGYAERLSLTPSQPRVARGLLARRVRIGRRTQPRCQRSVDVPPGTTTRVEVPMDSCLVFSMPPHW